MCILPAWFFISNINLLPDSLPDTKGTDRCDLWVSTSRYMMILVTILFPMQNLDRLLLQFGWRSKPGIVSEWNILERTNTAVYSLPSNTSALFDLLLLQFNKRQILKESNPNYSSPWLHHSNFLTRIWQLKAMVRVWLEFGKLKAVVRPYWRFLYSYLFTHLATFFDKWQWTIFSTF